VPAGLDPLRDHRVDPGRGGRQRLGDGADLDEDLDPVAVRGLHERLRRPPEQDQQRHPRPDRRRDLLGDDGAVPVRRARRLEVSDDDVDAERPVGQLADARSPPPDLLGGRPLPPSTPQPPAAETAATSSGPAENPKPTEKTGYSMPSFTGFLEQLLAAYPTAPVVAVVCDNVISHDSKLVNRWLADHPRVRMLHGARDSPTTTQSSGSGPRSRRGWPTPRR
jgi:hypothetical protein